MYIFVLLVTIPLLLFVYNLSFDHLGCRNVVNNLIGEWIYDKVINILCWLLDKIFCFNFCEHLKSIFIHNKTTWECKIEIVMMNIVNLENWDYQLQMPKRFPRMLPLCLRILQIRPNWKYWSSDVSHNPLLQWLLSISTIAAKGHNNLVNCNKVSANNKENQLQATYTSMDSKFR